MKLASIAASGVAVVGIILLAGSLVAAPLVGAQIRRSPALAAGQGFAPPPPIAFESAAHYFAGQNPRALVGDDFNHDGYLDLAVTLSDRVVVSLNISGTFSTTTSYPAPSAQLGGIDSGDLNGDGNPDLVFVNQTNRTVNVLLGTPSGAFQPGANFSTTNPINAIQLGDVNNDGRLDAVTPSWRSSFPTGYQGLVIAFYGNGTGTFGTPGNSITVVDSPQLVAVALGDVNNDSRLDIVATATNTNIYSVLLSANGSPQAMYSSGVGGMTPNAPTLAHLDGDAWLDMAVALPLDNRVMLHRNTGQGMFYPTIPLSGPYPRITAVRDLNGDAVQDIIVGVSDAVDIWLGYATMQYPVFSARVNLPGMVPNAMIVDDVNRDGLLDLVMGNSAGSHGVSVLLGRPVVLPTTPTMIPTPTPTATPTAIPTATDEPTATPTDEPTAMPTTIPTATDGPTPTSTTIPTPTDGLPATSTTMPTGVATATSAAPTPTSESPTALPTASATGTPPPTEALPDGRLHLPLIVR